MMKSLGAVACLISSLDSRTRIHRRIRCDSQSRITVNCRGRNRAHKLASDGTSTMITKREKKGRGASMPRFMRVDRRCRLDRGSCCALQGRLIVKVPLTPACGIVQGACSRRR